MKISILGHGVFGSAMGEHLSKKGHFILPEAITDDCEMVLVAVPSFVVAPILIEKKDDLKDKKIVICSKGFTEEGELISQKLEKEIPDSEVFFLYGPSLAEELRDGVLTAMVLAGKGDKELLKKEIESENLRIELSEDVVGVQVGEALKNVIAIFVGLIEGRGYGQNTRAFVFTRGLQEIQNFGVSLGAEKDTFLGLTCVGDLFVRSRNRLLGVSLGSGEKLNDIIDKLNYIPEGIITLKNAKVLAEKNGIEIKLIKILYSILFEELSIEDGLKMVE